MESREQINAVWQMQNYIEGHLDEPITLHALAKSAGYSPWHCARIFKELTGKTPFEYIRMYRLSKAAMELRDNDIKVVDVAMDFLFDSHEGFTRAFRRQFGMSPNEYKKMAAMYGACCAASRRRCMNQSACGFLTRCVRPVPHAMHRALNCRRTTEERSRRALISLICPNVK